MRREGREDRARGEAEHPRVPEVTARRDVVPRQLELRLLDEARDALAVRAVGGGAFDVAVAGLRARGLDAEGDQQPLAREGHRVGDGAREGRLVADEVVGGKHQHRGVRAHAVARPQRRERDRRGRVAPEGFQQVDVARARAARCGIHVLGREVVLAVGDGHQAGDAGERAGARGGAAEERAAVGKRQERLGGRLAGQRPQPGPGAAGEDHGYEGRHRTSSGHGVAPTLPDPPLAATGVRRPVL